MRKFKELSKFEKKKALELASNEAMKVVVTDNVKLNSQVELTDFLEPIAHSIAEEAFYPDKKDIVIKLWEK